MPGKIYQQDRGDCPEPLKVTGRLTNVKRIPAWLCVLVLTAFPAGQASAGGSPIEWDRSVYATGETAHGTVDFFPGCCDRGTPADGPYVAYLLPSSNGDEIPPMPEEAVNVGPVDLRLTGEDSGIAEFTFTVPDVSPGRYGVIPCNDPCTKILGDVIDFGFQIVENPSQADVLPLIKRREHRLKEWSARLLRRVERLELRTPFGFDRLVERVNHLETSVARLERELQGDASTPRALALVVLGGLGAVGAISWHNRRGERPSLI
jgi:hypothetical protein